MCETGRVDSGLACADLLTVLTVARLEAGTVLAFSNVDITIVVLGICAATRGFDDDFGLLAAVEVRKVRKLDVDVC